ncbi:antibiotic biosynthesis monooxygenase [Streptomyces sp. NPDC007851]|uniref:antibiotic biosynthesis monooxygenase n=1 Tax=Streptomyces sp. NPDC007851 TaxID=3155008 RepID=UPI0033CE9192
MTDKQLSEPSIIRTDGTDVTLLTARTVEPGHEETFQKWARGILDAAAASPGHLGGGLFRPATGDRPWIVVHRFRDQAALDAWLRSPARAAFFDNSAGHRHTEVARRELRGMETWFTGIGQGGAAPPRWKMAASAGLGIYPISLMGNGVLGPHLVGLPLVARTAVFAALFSVLMTYAAMPVVSRLLRRWLRPASAAPASSPSPLRKSAPP